MTIHQKLDELRRWAREIEGYRERIAQMESAAELPGGSLNVRTGGGKPEDRMAANIAKLAELREKLRYRVICLERKRGNMLLRISRLPPQQRENIRMRYVENRDWEEIARRTEYSIDHCYTIHRAALRRLAREEKWEARKERAI